MSGLRLRRVFRPLVYRIARRLAKSGVSPDIISVCSLLFAVISAIFVFVSQVVLAGFAIFLTGLLDGVDGAVARLLNVKSRRGAFLDAVIDRYGDLIIIGSFIFYRYKVMLLLSYEIWVMVALLGAFMVSYSRARGEAAGAGNLDVGLMARSERLFLLTVFCLLAVFDPHLPSYGIIILAVLSNLTALHRIIFAIRELRRTDQSAG